MARARIKSKQHDGPKFISSGCTLLDLALGGGWAEGRIANIVGDKSSGKTLLAIEAAANFDAKYPNGRILYRESEAAFDRPYAKALGMPISRVDFGDPMETVEEVFDDLSKVVKIKTPALYIIDSLDALSDQTEMARDFNEGTYGTDKARRLSQLFRRLVRQMHSANLTLLIISQVRSKIGLSFGRTTTRSGGRALDFYASQVAFLAHLGSITKTINKIKRPVGLNVKGKVDKNKVGLPLREVDFKLQFGYGIDDLASCVEWLKEVGRLDDIGVAAKDVTEFLKTTSRLPDDEYFKTLLDVQEKVKERWHMIETTFLPKRRKYQTAGS